METQLLLGDCLDQLKNIKDNTIDSIVTDPPYGLSFMGKKWDYDVPSTDIWEECIRVLKPGGHLLSFAGSRTYHRMAVRIEDAGFEIRDQIMWVYGSGFPKSHNIGHKVEDMQGWGTALKPAHEPIVMARKPLVGTVADNVLEWGTGGINIDGCRVPSADNDKYDIRTYDTYHKTFSSYAEANEEQTFSVNEKNELGRFPANIILDEEAGRILDEQSGNKKSIKRGTKYNKEYDTSNSITGFTPPTTAYSDNNTYGDEGGASRFFYCPKANKKDRDEGLTELQTNSKIGATYAGNQTTSKIGANPDKPTQPRANIHPTVKPTDLMGYLIRLVTPKGGVVLYPFTGSGSTGKAAVREGMNFIGIEREEEYFEIAKQRIEWEVSKKPNNKFWD
jgi:site-specific DNA-methyltransferase (adenine-specific)